MHRSTSAYWRIGLFLTTLLTRLWVMGHLWASGFSPAQGSDSLFYFKWALRILQGDWSDGAFYGLPGYPALLAGVFYLAGTLPVLVTVFQALSDSVTAVLIFEIGRRVSANQKCHFAGATAAIGWALFEPAQAFTAVLMPTSFATLIFWGAVYLTIRNTTPSASRPIFWVSIGLLAGLSSTMVGTLLFLVPWLMAWILFHTKVRTWALSLASLGLGVCAGTAPCWMYNHFVAREPVFLSAHSGINFYLGNNELADGYPRIPPGLRAAQEGLLQDSIRVAETDTGRSLKRYEVSRYWDTKAKDFIKEHPAQWLALLSRKVWNFWRAWEYDDISLLPLLRAQGGLIPGITFGLVSSLGLIGMVIGVRRNRDAIWIAGAIFALMCALLPVFITERYRMLAAPGLLVFSGICLERLWIAITLTQTKNAIAIVAAASAISILLAVPSHDPRLTSVSEYNAGLQLLNAGHASEARPHLEKAWRFAPDHPEVNFALGNLWFPLDKTKAERFYERILRIDPSHASSWTNLGVIAIQEKQWTLARERLEQAVRLNDSARAHFLLAVACHALLDYPAALRHANDAATKEPQNGEYREYARQLNDAAAAP